MASTDLSLAPTAFWTFSSLGWLYNRLFSHNICPSSRIQHLASRQASPVVHIVLCSAPFHCCLAHSLFFISLSPLSPDPIQGPTVSRFISWFVFVFLDFFLVLQIHHSTHPQIDFMMIFSILKSLLNYKANFEFFIMLLKPHILWSKCLFHLPLSVPLLKFRLDMFVVYSCLFFCCHSAMVWGSFLGTPSAQTIDLWDHPFSLPLFLQLGKYDFNLMLEEHTWL